MSLIIRRLHGFGSIAEYTFMSSTVPRQRMPSDRNMPTSKANQLVWTEGRVNWNGPSDDTIYRPG